MAFTPVAKVSEVPAGTGIEVTVSGEALALFNDNGTFFATDSACSHAGAALAEGECGGGEVVCPLHGARFNLATGAALSRPASRPVKTYRVQVVGDEVQVEL